MSYDTRLSAILESFSNDCLYPGLWKDGKLDKQIKKQLNIIAADFVAEHNIPKDAIKDIVMTGSMANFNWSDYSDIDLHILVNYSDINQNEDLVGDLMNLAKSKWNSDHSIKICDHEVEVYVQDDQEPHHSTGIYSLIDDKWIESPKKEDSSSQPSQISVERKAQKYINKIDKLKMDDYQSAEKLMEELKDMRMQGLKKGGEYSVENLAYKYLRNHQYIKLLKDKGVQAYDKKMTVSDCGEDDCE